MLAPIDEAMAWEEVSVMVASDATVIVGAVTPAAVTVIVLASDWLSVA